MVLLFIVLQNLDACVQCSYTGLMNTPSQPKHPLPEQILQLREKFGWTQSEAASLVYVTLRAWQWWESGKRSMPVGLWELLLIKAGLHPNFKRVR